MSAPSLARTAANLLVPPYGSYEEMVDVPLRQIFADAEASGAVSLRRDIIGHSVEGRALEAVTCTNAHAGTITGTRPIVLIVANIHGLEFIGIHVALGVLRAVARGDASALLEQCDVVFVPSANPDGLARTIARQGDDAVAGLRCNARGVDLNRNFPRPNGAPPSRLPFTGSSRAGSATYRGPFALSEPESAALADLLARRPVAATFGLHSFMGRVILPCTRSIDDHAGYAAITAAFRASQRHVRYPTLANRRLDVFTGELEDHVHHVHDAWSMCVETFSIRESLRQHLRAPSAFWRFNPRDVARWVENDAPAVLAAAQVALELGPPSLHRRRRSSLR